MTRLASRVRGKYHRTLAMQFGRRMARVEVDTPLISFTFDDAPRSAFERGGDLLGEAGARATYFVSLGLLGMDTEVGPIASTDDLRRAVERGDELGCHTYDHLDAWDVSTSVYAESIENNARTLKFMFPEQAFRTFAYPKSGATLSAKRRIQGRFGCARGGGQVANVGLVDLNLVSAFFLDRRTNANLDDIKAVIDVNEQSRGWLVFATHDVSPDPSPFGCTVELLRETIRNSVASGARILTMTEACERVCPRGKELPPRALTSESTLADK
jgi:peptidoglycan/xylan/chitin deacetylase (PgdA/CDA1 family)